MDDLDVEVDLAAYVMTPLSLGRPSTGCAVFMQSRLPSLVCFILLKVIARVLAKVSGGHRLSM